jgi:type IV conjugative transfer system coupling protein TraD
VNKKADFSADSPILIRAGHMGLHRLRMWLPLVRLFIGIAGVLLLLFFASFVWLETSHYERYLLREMLWAHCMPWLNPNASLVFITPSGLKIPMTYRVLQASKLIQVWVHAAQLKLLYALLASFFMTLLCGFGGIGVLKRWGKTHSEDSHIQGDILETERPTSQVSLSKNIHAATASSAALQLATLTLPPGVECAHLLFHGTTGTGKSTAIKALLEQIRARGDRAIVYDKSCNYLEEFYQPDKDILLNPLDQRGEAWDLWLECRDAADFDSLAAAQIPLPLSAPDPFWIQAARTVFAATAFTMRKDKQRSPAKLLQYLLAPDLQKLQCYLKGTEAEALISEKIEKVAASLQSVLATYLKSLHYLPHSGTAFSIRQWIQNEQATEWLFITSLGDRHESLKPLISAWLDIAVNALLSLPPSSTRRIWLILDELASLQPLPYLTQALSEARKFGGCIVIGVQNYAQLAKVYGPEGAKEISSLLNTRVMFREPDPDIAQWSALNLGETVQEESREGISFGTQKTRDGMSLQRVETRQPLVSFSEIMRLPNLAAYVRLPGAYPITRLNFTHQQRASKNAPFLLRALSDRPLGEEETSKKQVAKPKKSSAARCPIIPDIVLR